jgi:CheY-like chemotaxis protein
MPTVLICAPDPLTDALYGTVVWREDIERHLAARFEDALTIAVAARPNLVVVACDLPRAERLVTDLRHNPSTRQTSIVVLASGEYESSDLQFLLSGANAVLRLPLSVEDDARLGELMCVPPRCEVRCPVTLQFEGRTATPVETVRGTTLNLSASGMLVVASAVLDVGTDLDFQLLLPDEHAQISGSGQVVRHAGGQRYGVRFYGLEGGGREAIDRLVALANAPRALD